VRDRGREGERERTFKHDEAGEDRKRQRERQREGGRGRGGGGPSIVTDRPVRQEDDEENEVREANYISFIESWGGPGEGGPASNSQKSVNK
jgi:hypothetical protein